jgi:hypothetical protein
MRLLRDDFVFHARRVGQTRDSLRITARDRGRRGQEHRSRRAGRHECRFHSNEPSDALADSVLQLTDLYEMVGCRSESRKHFGRHQGSTERRQRSGCVDDGFDA